MIAWSVTLSNITGLRLPSDEISIDTPPSVQVLKKSKGGSEEVSLIYTCHLMIYDAIDYPEVEGNNSRLFNEAKRNISEAIDSNEMTSLLQYEGKQEGYVNYEAVQTGSYSFSYVLLDQGSSSSSNDLSGGGIAGMIILCLIYFLITRKRSTSNYKDIAINDSSSIVVAKANSEMILFSKD